MLRPTLVTGLVAALAAADEPRQPHLVLMVIDDVGWADIGYHGSAFPTPNMDALSADGVRLERYYVDKVCSPTRSAFMTGRYTFHTGMQHTTTLDPGSEARLPLDRPTLPEALGKVGYRNYMIGKWHLGYASWDYTPLGRGFDSFAGYLQGQVDYYNKTIGIGPLNGFDFWRNRTTAWEEVGRYSMDFYMDEAERIVEAHDPSVPMFLYFAHQEIHIPLEGPPEPEYAANCVRVDGKNRQVLCSMMNRLDKAVGDFVTLLKRQGMWDNTLLWVSTDNGGMPAYQEAWPASASSNRPLRAGKATLFEGGVRAVSFVAGGALPAAARGSEVRSLLQHVDVAATLAGLAGADLGDIDGLNVWETVSAGKPSGRTEVPLNVVRDIWDTEGHRDFSAVIQYPWKLIKGLPGLYDGWWSDDPYSRTAPTEEQGPIKVNRTDVWLFDIEKDERELENVAAAHLDIVARLAARLDELADPKKGYVAPQSNWLHPRSLPFLHNGTWAPFLRRSAAGAVEAEEDGGKLPPTGGAEEVAVVV